MIDDANDSVVTDLKGTLRLHYTYISNENNNNYNI